MNTTDSPPIGAQKTQPPDLSPERLAVVQAQWRAASEQAAQYQAKADHWMAMCRALDEELIVLEDANPL